MAKPSNKKQAPRTVPSPKGAAVDSLGHGEGEWTALVFLLSRIGRVNDLFLQGIQEGLLRISSRGHTEAECFVLISLIVSGAPYWLSPSVLSDYSLQTPGGMTKTLRRLEDAGLVRRRMDETDRRAFLVGLTSKGEKIARRLLDRTVAQYSHAFSGLNADERHDVAKTLRALLTVLERATGRTSTEVWVKVE